MKRCSIKIKDLITMLPFWTAEEYILLQLGIKGINLRQPILIWFDIKNETMNYENIQTKEENHEDER